MHRNWRIPVVLFALTMSLAACSGHDEASSPPANQSQVQQLTPEQQQQYQANAAAYAAEQKKQEAAAAKATTLRLQKLVSQAAPWTDKLSAVVTDFCRHSPYSEAADMQTSSQSRPYQSAIHERFYAKYWRATATGQWDQNLYRAAGKSCQDKVPDEYRPKQPLSVSDLCPDGRPKNAYYGCAAAG